MAPSPRSTHEVVVSGPTDCMLEWGADDHACSPRVTEVVEALHASGIVHGDLRAHNILVEEKADGTDVMHLVDFEHAMVTRERTMQEADLEAMLEMFRSCEVMDMSD
jgi:tRNA A-37 threonylcarbamoyl transferase component Bud32